MRNVAGTVTLKSMSEVTDLRSDEGAAVSTCAAVAAPNDPSNITVLKLIDANGWSGA